MFLRDIRGSQIVGRVQLLVLRSNLLSCSGYRFVGLQICLCFCPGMVKSWFSPGLV